MVGEAGRRRETDPGPVDSRPEQALVRFWSCRFMALSFAVEYLPLIAQELLKTRHRRIANWDEGGVTVGSQAQAYGYWLEHGKFWQNTPGALDFLRSQLGKSPE